MVIQLLVLLSLCTRDPVLPSQAFPVGEVIDTVKCLRSPRQSYALYLPKDYSRDQPLGVIFFYEPAARGSLPLKRYKELAERYHLILICSNNSRNGPFEVTFEAEEAILPDVIERFAVDSKKIYVSGFSGGARAAILLAGRKPVYAGIIACGAASALDDHLMTMKSVPFIETVGNQDMNFTEALNFEGHLQSRNYPHALILFEGPHQWPPEAVYDQALIWQLSRQQNTLPETETKRYFALINNLVQQQLDSTDIYLAYLNVARSTFQPPWAHNFFDSLQNKISSDGHFGPQQKSFAATMKQEDVQKKQFYEMFARLSGAASDTVFHAGEWKSFIASQNRHIKSKDRQESLMGQRILTMMRGGCSESYAYQFRSEDYFHATLTARLMTLLDEHYRSYLALARTYAARNMSREAIQALKKSVALGLKEKAVLEKDKYFQNLKDEKAFQDILKKLG